MSSHPTAGIEIPEAVHIASHRNEPSQGTSQGTSSQINLEEVIRNSEYTENTSVGSATIVQQQRNNYDLALANNNNLPNSENVIENTRLQIVSEEHRQLQKYLNEPDNVPVTSQDIDSDSRFPPYNSYDLSPGDTLMASRPMDNIKNTTTNTQESRNNSQSNRAATVMALYVGLLTAVGGFLYGYDTGIINGLLEMGYVKEHFAVNSDKTFSASQQSVTTGMLSVGTFFGSLLAPLTSDKIGRRLSIVLCTSIIFTLGTILQLVSDGLTLLIIGRFVSGIGVGVISAVIPLYQAEASPKWIRGSVISLYQWAITWGLLVSSAVTQGTHLLPDSRCYRVPIGIQLIWGTFLSVGMYMLPESPRFYVKNDNLDDAIISLSRFRRLPPDNEQLIEELIEIKAAHDYEMSFGPASIWDCFTNSPSRISQKKRMFTGIMTQALQQCSGVNFIFYYGVNFFVKTGVGQSYLISFVTYTVNVVFTIPGIILVEVLGRRRLFIVGAAGMTVSNFVIAAVGVAADSVFANKVMIAFVCSFIAFFAATWGPLAWVLVGEIFGLSVRQKAVSITAATNWLVNFIFAFSTPFLIDTGKHTAALGTDIFFLWGSLNFAGLVFAYFFIYETKGLMLEEIDELYKVCPNARQSLKFKSKLAESVLPSSSEGKSNFSKEGQNSGSSQSGNFVGTESTAVSDNRDPNSLVNYRSIHPKESADSENVVRQRFASPSTDLGTGTTSGNSISYNNALIMNNIINMPNNTPPSLSSILDQDFELDDLVPGTAFPGTFGDPPTQMENPTASTQDNLDSNSINNNILSDTAANNGSDYDIPNNTTNVGGPAVTYNYSNEHEFLNFLQDLSANTGFQLNSTSENDNNDNDGDILPSSELHERNIADTEVETDDEYSEEGEEQKAADDDPNASDLDNKTKHNDIEYDNNQSSHT